MVQDDEKAGMGKETAVHYDRPGNAETIAKRAEAAYAR